MSTVKPEIHESVSHAQVVDLTSRQAYEQAWSQFAQQQTPEQFCGNWLLIQCHTIGGASDGVVVLHKPGATSFAPVAFYPESTRDRSLLAGVTELALKQGRGIVEPRQPPADSDASGPRYQIAYPIRLDGQIHGVIGLEIDWRPEGQLQAAMRALQWGSAWLELMLRRHVDPSESERLRSRLALDLVSTLLEQAGLKESATAFATELAARFGCDRVSLGLLEGHHVKVLAVSHSPRFEQRANLLRAVERAMEESIDQAETVLYPPQGTGLPVVSRAHEALVRESEAGGAATFPLSHGGRVIGALTLERASGYQFDAPSLVVCEAVASVAGPVVELKRSRETKLPAHAGRSAREFWERLVGAGHSGLKLATAAGIAIALFFSFATGDYRVSANAAIEGSVQRAVTAPINGYVKEARLRAGDPVRQGQIVCRLEDRDLLLERVKLESQRDQYIRQYREAIAKRERAQALIFESQISQSEAQLQLVEEQLGRVEMVAPIDGVIVSGDLSQKLGSPVERGQVLFEIAPLDSYRVVLQVDERDIADIHPGQHGELTVSSIPGERFIFTVARIMPVNTAKEGRNFFRVEGALSDRPGSRLRPRMEGVGKILVDERKLVWIWTHGFTDWLRLWIWNWLP